MTDALPTVDAWWSSVEGSSAAVPDEPAWLADLREANAATLEFRLDEAATRLDRARPSAGAAGWDDVVALLDLRLQARRARPEELGGARAALEASIARLPSEARATRARARHLLGVVCVRLDQLDAAEEALSTALEEIGDGPARAWVLDTIAQVLVGQGAWHEARRTMEAVASLKETAGDHLGVAITRGHLGRMELSLDRPLSAREVARETLREHGPHLVALSRVRLQTLVVEATLAAGESAEGEGAVLEGMLAEAGPGPHYLVGYAALALARCLSAVDRQRASAWLRRAEESLTLPDQIALCRYHEARMRDGFEPDEAWYEGMRALVAETGAPTEAELGVLLMHAESAARAGDLPAARRDLEVAHDRAASSNNRLWVDWVDRVSLELDPAGVPERMARRYAGRSFEELGRTSRHEVSIVFADLVSFTPRSLELSPEEVMATVRSLFELSVPVLATHRVRPLSYLGDGLLAVAEGDDHRERALAFSLAMVRRAARVSRVRRALGSPWGLDLRAGVASGPVVMGTLGSHFKMEFAAIGLTTNRAARLQGQAEPGEVVCDLDTGRHRQAEGRRESLELKGFSEPVAALRFRAE